MLTSLHIENIAVIKRLDIDFTKGFSAMTGETGAGKSIIIDSINLLLGNKVPRDLIRTGEESAVVCAVFEELSPALTEILSSWGIDCPDGTLMLRKTLNREGRSKTYLGTQAITQAMQKEIAGLLVSIHGQSDNQKLLQKSNHLSLLDAYADPRGEKQDYRQVYEAWQQVQRQLKETLLDDGEKLRLSEMLKYQIADIDALGLREGEEEALEKERDRLLYAEKINRQAEEAYHLLKGRESGAVLELLTRSQNALRPLYGIVEGAEALAERLSEAASEIYDVAETVLSFADDDRSDPTARIDRLEGRLDAISKLKRKYGTTVGEVLAFRDSAAQRLEQIQLSDEHRIALEKRAGKLEKQLREKAAALTACRKRAALEVQERVAESLAFLDMPRVRFEIKIAPAPCGENGADDVEFMIATNAGEPLLPMIRIASGGELSRIMLALRSTINDREGADTLIYDEVDTGVSGKTARRVGIKLRESAVNAQVLCVTHSAQIASLADSHYLIAKTEEEGRAYTGVTLLTPKARVEEIARILGGIEITDAQRAAAREMLSEYKGEAL